MEVTWVHLLSKVTDKCVCRKMNLYVYVDLKRWFLINNPRRWPNIGNCCNYSPKIGRNLFFDSIKKQVSMVVLSLRNHYFRKRLRRNRFADHAFQLSRWSSSFRTLKHRPVCGASGEQVSPVLFQLLPEQHDAVVLCQQTEPFSNTGRRSFSIGPMAMPSCRRRVSSGENSLFILISSYI